MPVDSDWIAAHLPHTGAMLLIDRVVAWDAQAVHCRTRSHLRSGNPLRCEGRLGAISGVEYAAQAMAIHGALLQRRAAYRNGAPERMQGYLAAARDVQLHVDCLDDFAGDLEIMAERLAALDGGASYRYRISHATTLVQTGQLTLRFSGTAGGRPRVAA